MMLTRRTSSPQFGDYIRKTITLIVMGAPAVAGDLGLLAISLGYAIFGYMAFQA